MIWRRGTKPGLYLDTNVLIRVMEGTDKGAAEATRLFELHDRSRVILVTSELTISEAMVAPIRRNEDFLAQAYVDLISNSKDFELHKIRYDVLAAAAHIRARSAAKLPDSIHVATAVQGGCDFIISYDRRLAGLSEIKVINPSDKLLEELNIESP